MSYTVTTTINNLERKTDDNTVIKVFYTFTLAGENGESNVYNGSLRLPVIPKEEYQEGTEWVPYETLTEEVVIGWIEAQYSEKIARIKRVMAKEAGIDVGEEIAKPW